MDKFYNRNHLKLSNNSKRLLELNKYDYKVIDCLTKINLKN